MVTELEAADHGDPANRESPDLSALLHRHTVLVRIAHWVNALSFLALLVSGIAILMAHPRLYWGESGYFGEPALLELPLPVVLEQTGWGRSLHFLAAWILVLNGLWYLVASLLNGHVHRDLLPTRAQMRLRHIARDIGDHLRLLPQRGEAARHYNFLQKIAYLLVIFVLFPLMVLSGLTMSPAVASAHPWLFDLFAGRQSARTVHFICASLLLLFVLIHIGQVFVAGFANTMRAMLTGRMRIPLEPS
jgi:thiosulfate reductase cytochrome b subunit